MKHIKKSSLSVSFQEISCFWRSVAPFGRSIFRVRGANVRTIKTCVEAIDSKSFRVESMSSALLYEHYINTWKTLAKSSLRRDIGERSADCSPVVRWETDFGKQSAGL